MKGALQSGAIVADFCMGIPDLILGRGGNEKPDDSQVKMGLDIGLAGAAGRGVTMGTGFLAGGTGGAIGTGVGAPASLGINGLEGRKINSDNTKQKIGVVSDLGTKAGTLLAQGTGGLLAGVITVARFVPAAGKVAVIGVFGLVGAVISPFAGAVSALAHKAKK